MTVIPLHPAFRASDCELIEKARTAEALHALDVEQRSDSIAADFVRLNGKRPAAVVKTLRRMKADAWVVVLSATFVIGVIVYVLFVVTL